MFFVVNTPCLKPGAALWRPMNLLEFCHEHGRSEVLQHVFLIRAEVSSSRKQCLALCLAFTWTEMEEHACEEAWPVASMASPIHDTWRFWSVVSLSNVGAWGYCRILLGDLRQQCKKISCHCLTIHRDSRIANYSKQRWQWTLYHLCMSFPKYFPNMNEKCPSQKSCVQARVEDMMTRRNLIDCNCLGTLAPRGGSWWPQVSNKWKFTAVATKSERLIIEDSHFLSGKTTQTISTRPLSWNHSAEDSTMRLCWYVLPCLLNLHFSQLWEGFPTMGCDMNILWTYPN